MREYVNGTYPLRAYFLALLMSNLLLCGLNVLVLATPVYLLLGFPLNGDRVGVFLACLLLMSTIGGALGVMVGCVAKDIDGARATIIPTLAPLLIFSGYLIPFKSIPFYFK